MRESFDEYRSIIETNLVEVSYLYSGDIISYSDEEFTNNISHSKTSPRFIIDVIDFIYEKSIKSMISKSILVERCLDFNKLDINGYWVSEIVNSLDNIKSDSFVFIGDVKNIGIIKGNNKKPFPDYFYDIKNLGNSNKLYKCPYIDVISDEITLYIVDKPIQSLVYSIQNMTYDINKNSHTLKYKFYQCDYSSYKLVIKDISKMRNDKIDFILNS
jgi:hypothetical protein